MAKPEQLLRIEPANELRFRGPFTSPSTSYIKLLNPTNKKIFFKIKTTAPKRYCVRPNCGTLEANEQVSVAVSLQPFDYDPAEKNKHKFMVLSTIAPEGGDHTCDNIWQTLKPEDTMDSKLKCVFEFPSENEDDLPAAGDDIKKVPLESKPATKPPPEIPMAADLAKDVINLRMEESSLRQENLELREEILRLKRERPAERCNISSQSTSLQEPQARPMSDLIIAIVIALVGMILGKIFL